jgi:double zinc ribbon protein
VTDSMELTENNNWYAFLRLSPEATAEEIQSAVERLSRQASALAATAPERSQLLRETIRSIKRDLLSGPENRRRYDASRPPDPALRPMSAAAWPTPSGSAPGAPAPGAPAPGAPAPVPPEPVPYAPTRDGVEGFGSRLARFLRTGWTCPACGNEGVPSDKFCTKCGTPIQPIRPDARAPERMSRPRVTCATCANPLGPMDAFCSKCGSRR